MTHASLFSGIGGAELAASWMGWTNLFHCEINPFGRKVLEHWFPNSISYDDITKTDFTTWRGKVDVLTGGFPCQPFSLAGRRKGAEDDRYLWPEMLRAIGEIQPAWVVGENVAGLITMVQPGETADMGRTDDLFEENHLYRTVQEYTLDAIIRSLESIGYAVLSFLVPACAVGAPHRRDRLWIVAHRTDAGTENEPARTVQPHTARHAADTDSDGCGRRTDKPQRKSGSRRQTDARAACKTTTPPLGLLPTPNAIEGYKYNKRYDPTTQRGSSLMALAVNGLLLTPSAADGGIRAQMTMENLKNHHKKNAEQSNLAEQIANKVGGGNSHLSPLFVEEMMGYPLTYLVLPFLNPRGERKQ